MQPMTLLAVPLPAGLGERRSIVEERWGMSFRTGVFTLTAASALALAVSANAADMYRAPEAVGGYKDGPAYVTADWSGFYAGVNGGYAFDARDRHAGILDDGGFGGGQIGYNWQGVFHPHLVLGVEADIQGAGIDNKGVATLLPSGNLANHEINIDYFGTVRGRLGYAAGSLLVYGTGGFAYGSVFNQFRVPATGNVFTADSVRPGFVAGGGVEYKFSRAWSVKAEYQYLDFERENANLTSGGPARARFVTTADQQLNTIRAGINYHFGNVYEPLK
jgi:outer membrane immunogenic protein